MDRTPNRPRKAAAIHSATLELLAERGYDALTVEAIADRAGVNKTTVYRTWATKDEVLADSLVHAPELALDVPDTGGLRGDLIAFAEHVLRLVTEPSTLRIVSAMLAGAPDRPATAAAAHRFFADRLGREQVIFDRARRRGELPEAADPEMLIDVIGGAIWLHVLARGGSPDRDHLAALVDTALLGATRA